MLNAGRRRGGSPAVFCLGALVVVFVVGNVPSKVRALAEEVADGWRWWDARAATALARPTGRLLVAVVFVVVVDVEATDPADGGRGGRRVVAEVNDVAVDLVRECCAVTGDSGFVVDAEVAFVVTVGEGR